MCVELRAVPVVLEGSLPGAAQTMRKQNQKQTQAKKSAVFCLILNFMELFNAACSIKKFHEIL